MPTKSAATTRSDPPARNTESVTKVGNLTKDPELRFGAEKGTPFTSFGLAVNTPKVPGEWSGDQRTDFYDVVCFGTLAEHAAESLSKGARMLVTGGRSWTTTNPMTALNTSASASWPRPSALTFDGRPSRSVGPPHPRKLSLPRPLNERSSDGARAWSHQPIEDEGDGATPPIEQFRRMQVNLRYWPGLGGWRSPQKPASTVRLKDRMGFYSSPFPRQAWCPNAWASVRGFWRSAALSSLRGSFTTMIGRSCPEDVQGLRQWCDENPIDTSLGPDAQLYDAHRIHDRSVSPPRIQGRSAVVGADLGRTLGLMADWWAPSRRTEFRGGWSLGLRGWGVIAEPGGQVPLVRQLRTALALRPRGQRPRHQGGVWMAPAEQ